MNIQDARRAAAQDLSERSHQIPVEIADSKTVDAGWCWVFFYDSKANVQSGILVDRVAGNGPLVVDKETGQVHQLGTARPLADQLEQLRVRLGRPAGSSG